MPFVLPPWRKRTAHLTSDERRFRHNLAVKKWKLAHPDYIKSYNRSLNGTDRKRLYRRKSYLKNKDKYKATRKLYDRAHNESIKSYRRSYYAINRNRILALHKLARLVRHSKKKNEMVPS